MQIGIAGAGSVGCFFCGVLQQAGHHVTCLAKGKHLEALKRDGLTKEKITMFYILIVPSLIIYRVCLNVNLYYFV